MDEPHTCLCGYHTPTKFLFIPDFDLLLLLCIDVAMFAGMEMQQMLKLCGSFPSCVCHFVTRVFLCPSVCVYKLSSKEAIKTLHSIGARRQEFLYKHQSSGGCRGTLPLTRSTNTHTMNEMKIKISVRLIQEK